MWLGRRDLLSAALAGVTAGVAGCSRKNSGEILNVSYDPTREFYGEYNELFAKKRGSSGGSAIAVRQSHGGSGKQARSVIDGLEADVVTLALGYDIDQIAERGLVAKNWQTKFADDSAPYTSAIVFLVRKGNPKGIKDWDDLVRDGIEVITPNPKTSGGARWNYLAAWGYELGRTGNDEAKARSFVEALFKRVPVLDSGARGSTITFVERKIGDVLLAWENEALLAVAKLGAGEVEVVVPSVSIVAEPPVAVVDKIVDRRGTREVATAYLDGLYAEDGQRLAAKHFYRPRNATVLAENAATFKKIELFTVGERFGGWAAAQPLHFADGGMFDKVHQGDQ